MKLFTLLYFLLFVTNLAISQTTNSADAIKQAIENNKSATITASLFILEHPSKKEQFFSPWSKGTIHFKNGQTATNCQLRYNTWKDELIWLRESDYKTGTVLKNTVSAFTINANEPDKKKFIKYFDEQSLLKQQIYLEVLAEGSIGLYCHRKVSYIKTNDSFSNKFQFYLRKNGIMYKVKLSKKSLKPHFTENEQRKLKAILQENHLRIKHEYELAKALEIFSE